MALVGVTPGEASSIQLFVGNFPWKWLQKNYDKNTNRKLKFLAGWKEIPETFVIITFV